MYDYIIVGGGSAGCVLAHRLSEDPRIQVCLLEAGSADKNPMIHMPGGLAFILSNKKLNWDCNTEPQQHLNNRRLYWPRGKVLGGSSSLNAMVYIRGNSYDYDHWAELGNRGWSYQDVLPYFKKAEHQEHGPSDYHGVGGPLNVSDLRFHNELSDAFVQAMTEKGYPHNEDFNGATQEGAGLYQVTQVSGQRCSAARAYLRPIQERSNLRIITNALAVRIVFEGKRTTGIQYTESGLLQPVLKAKKEVILCGGAINSPQLLLLSGVGPKQEIEPHGIKMVHELPGVGHNLQDHLDILLVQKSTQPVSYGISWSSIPKQIKAAFDYMLFKQGMFTSNIAEGGGFIKVANTDIPDVQLHFLPGYVGDHGREAPKFGLHCYSLHLCQLRPKSRGYIGLKTPNPFDAPKIQPNYLSAEEDRKVLLKAAQVGQEILAAEAFAPYRGESIYPGDNVQTEEQLMKFVRERAETIYHPVGSCKMGQDEMAVVDTNLRVHGLEGLRVVDASIMPTLIGGNTNAPTIMIAEKAADMILQTSQ